ncbi:flippase-like domain-containing protein [Candidatus Bathyarchaeota archaeon]|nr:flippase-like domain-containing protein [Candidatus Bathyarchaeota archaeon]
MSEKRKFLLRTVPLLVVGLLLFLLYLVIFVDIPEMINVIQQVDLFIYSLAAVALLSDTALFALAWQYLLIPLSVKVPMKKTFLYVWIGVFTDLLIPAESVSGDIVKVYLMSKEPNVNPGKVVASLVGLRILAAITTVATLSISFLVLLMLDYSISGVMVQILFAVTVMSALAFILLVVFCFKESWTERFIYSLMNFIEWISRGRLKLGHFQTKISDGLKVFYQSLRIFSSKPIRLIPPIILYVSAWSISTWIVFIVFTAVGYSDPGGPFILLLKTVVVYTLLMAIKSVPIGIPAEVGIPEIFMTMSFILFGIPEEISAAVTVLTRILTMWLRFLIGFVAVQWLGIKNFIGSENIVKAKDKIRDIR